MRRPTLAPKPRPRLAALSVAICMHLAYAARPRRFQLAASGWLLLL